MTTNRASVLGVGLDPLTTTEVVDRCAQAIEARQPLILGMVNAAKLVNMGDDALLREAVASCDLVLADGMSVVWASRLLRRPLPERVAGIDLFVALLEWADEKSKSIYLLGARQEVLDEVIARIGAQFPNARIAGSRNGYFEDARTPEIVDDIRMSGADMLFVAISPPKKELFLWRWGRKTGAPVCHGVGGSFDVLAGRVDRAPEMWQKLGIEWLHRVVQEPRRMWRRYLVTNSKFLARLAMEILGRAPRQPAPVEHPPLDVDRHDDDGSELK